MSATFTLKGKPPKYNKVFIFSKGPYLVIAGPIDMNVDVF